MPTSPENEHILKDIAAADDKKEKTEQDSIQELMLEQTKKHKDAFDKTLKEIMENKYGK